MPDYCDFLRFRSGGIVESRRGRSGRRWLVKGSTLDGFGRGKLASDSRDRTFRRFGVFGWLPKRNLETRVLEEEKVKLVPGEEKTKHEIRLLEKDGGQWKGKKDARWSAWVSNWNGP